MPLDRVGSTYEQKGQQNISESLLQETQSSKLPRAAEQACSNPEQKLESVDKLHRKDRLKPGEVLWDVAERSLNERARITGEPKDRDSRYREVNRIMQNSGFEPAHLDGKRDISDKDLPNSWNSITNHTPLIIYTEDQLKELRDKVKKACKQSPPSPPPGDPDAGKPPAAPSDNKVPRAVPPNGDTDAGKPPAAPVDKNAPQNDPSKQAEQPKPDYMKFVDQLRRQHEQISSAFDKNSNGQGVIGQAFDAAKNNLGTSARDGFMSNLWSNVLDKDSGSVEINRKIKQEAGTITKLEEAARAHNDTEFKRLYRDLTASDFDPARPAAHNLKTTELPQRYENSQSTGVETITDTSAAIAALAAARFGRGTNALNAFTRSAGAGAVLGAGTKAGLKQIDGRYANLREDLVTGGIWGSMVPLGDIAGAKVSRILSNKTGLLYTGNLITGQLETQGAGLGLRTLSAAAKTGVSGSVFGAGDGATRSVMEDLKAEQSIDAWKAGKRTLEGATLGFLGGTLLGMGADGIADGFRRRNAGPLSAPEAKVVNGVEVTRSGLASVDDAAKMMSTDAEAFNKKASIDPYGAVSDAAKLFDEHGVNIRKVNSKTGDLLVPNEFNEAMNLVQSVDGLTAKTRLSLSDKIPVVKSVDEFVSGPKANSVQESLERLKTDQNYKEVIRLTREQHGESAAQALENKFQQGLQKELKTGTAVERVINKSSSLEDAFAKAQKETESKYQEKAADFFKDMTDPAQRQRLNELVDHIYEKFNPQTISRAQLGEIVEQFPREQQALAVAILDKSANNMSEVGIRMRMQALRHEMESVTGQGIPDNVYTLSPDSSGNLLGYLFRKSNSSSMSIKNIDKLASDMEYGNIPKNVVLFDDIASASITPEQKAILAKIPEVYVIDAGAFSKGINIIDMSSGPAAVSAKLQSLVTQASDIAARNQSLLPTGVAKELLDGSVDNAASSIGSNVKVIRESGKWSAPNLPKEQDLSLMEPLDAVYARITVPKATKEDIADFLSGYAGQERELAARMLAEGAVNNSFPTIIAKAQLVNKQIEAILHAGGAKKSDFLMVVDKDPGGSTHLVTYLFGKANGLESGNYISSQQLNRMIADGSARGKVIAYMDDTIYSGSQAASMLDSNVNSFMPFKKVVVGGFGAYDTGLNKIQGTHLARIGKVSVATADNYQPFYSNKHPFFGTLDAVAQNKVRSIGGYEGFGGVQGSQIWAYMYPDNNLTFFGSRFAGSVLKLPGP